MLSNDTWFMYAGGKKKRLYADGFMNDDGTPENRADPNSDYNNRRHKAGGQASANADYEIAKANKDTTPEDLKAIKMKSECWDEVAKQVGCKKGQAGGFCTGKVNNCIKHRLDSQAKAASVASDAAMAKATADALNDGSDDGSTAPKAGAGLDLAAAGGDDNTMLYIAGGIGGVIVLGLIVMMVMKKRGQAATTPAAA